MNKYKREKILLELTDPLGRKIILGSKEYKHVKKCHPTEVLLIETVKNTIKDPISIWEDEKIEKEEEKVWYYFNEIEFEKVKLTQIKKRYIIIIVKNRKGNFRIITWYAYNTLSKKGARKIWEREERK